MSFNPDSAKQAQEVIFSKKNKKQKKPHKFTTLSKIKLISNQKHLRFTLYSNLSFHKHINDKINHANKGVSLAQKFLTILQRTTLLIIITCS